MKNINHPQTQLTIVRPPLEQPEPTLEEIARLAAMVQRHLDEGRGDEGRKLLYQRAIAPSGLLEGEVADALGIDRGQWSRTMNQGVHQQRWLHDFCRVVGNRIVLHVDAYLAGYRLEPLESELQRQLREEREERHALEQKLKHFEDFMSLGSRRAG